MNNKVEYIPGDLVMYKGNVETVVEVDRDNTLSVTTDKHPFAPLSNIKPIPLTPKILEKNGWRHQNDWYFFLELDRGHIGIDFYHITEDGKFIVDFDNEIISDIKFISDLQHLLFGLGIDSNIKL